MATDSISVEAFDLVGKLMAHSSNELANINKSLREDEYRVGWDDGYAAGYTIGARATELRIREALGIFQDGDILASEDTQKETWRTQNIEHRKKELR